MLCPPTFIVDATETSREGGVAAEVCISVYDSALFFETFMHVYVRTTYDQIYSAKKKVSPPGGQVSGWTRRARVQNFTAYLLKTGVDNLDFSAENMCNLRSYS